MNIHRECKGRLSGRKCTKCGKTWSIVTFFTASDIEFKEDKKGFDSVAYRERLRSRKDIQPK